MSIALKLGLIVIDKSRGCCEHSLPGHSLLWSGERYSPLQDANYLRTSFPLLNSRSHEWHTNEWKNYRGSLLLPAFEGCSLAWSLRAASTKYTAGNKQTFPLSLVSHNSTSSPRRWPARNVSWISLHYCGEVGTLLVIQITKPFAILILTLL